MFKKLWFGLIILNCLEVVLLECFWKRSLKTSVILLSRLIFLIFSLMWRIFAQAQDFFGQAKIKMKFKPSSQPYFSLSGEIFAQAKIIFAQGKTTL